MEKIVVRGGRPLSGEVTVGGSKNAALPLLFAGILTQDRCVFENLPRVSDVLTTLQILRSLGARMVFLPGGEVEIDYRFLFRAPPPAFLTGAIRGSVYLMGALLGRFGRAQLPGFGGCNFGTRPIDQHLMGFALLGAQEEKGADGSLLLSAPGGLTGAEIRLAMPSVGATGNLMMAAVAAGGETVIENAAAEPHMTALAEFLRSAGAEIEGVGSGTLRVRGGRPLHGCRVRVIPDMIEAGTYLCAGMACGGRVTVREAEPSHLGAVLELLDRMGADLSLTEKSVTLNAPEHYTCLSFATGPYPGFPTDLHPQFGALFSIGGRAVGQGGVTETVFSRRFRYTEGLRAMGADIRVSDAHADFTPAPLHPARLCSPDLRGGAALLLAALATPGESVIEEAATIGRGYEHLEEKCRSLGADLCVT
ncbi:MAG: UDP-N-acetylglucosamine 1-carboxyvinyltransferase [Eubacteriales bacterium]|nr:UDP-N-acetylglucosamine 1-carboxyvinyltransferase [Eubacteriales bacterium]